MSKDKKPAKLNRRDLKSGVIVTQANNNLFYKNGKGKTYTLIAPLKDEPRTYITFIPECNGDNDIWDEHLEIVGADCEVWVTEKWVVLNSDGENITKDIHAFLCKWSTAVKKYGNLIKTTDLEGEGYFEILNKDTM